MGLILLEALGALLLLLLIVWWTMFSGRVKGELPGLRQLQPPVPVPAPTPAVKGQPQASTDPPQ